MIDLGGRNVDEAGLISVDVEAGDSANDLSAFVADGEAVAEDGGVGGKRGCGEDREAEGELDRLVHSSICQVPQGLKPLYWEPHNRSAEALRHPKALGQRFHRG